ncbi:MAG TPA: TlpA disulfide reductase family protein [Burkholderiales bacterium]|nr:TlpA disulfide reductase family protein [Burkholderiales bacterium]
MLARQFRIIISLVLLLAVSGARGAPDIGDTPPDYLGKTLDGVPVLVSQHAGKVVVVSFWATWCPYCLKELPILNGLQKLAGKEQMHVVAVNTEERAVFRKVVNALKSLDLHHSYDPGESAQKAYGVNGLPHMLIIGRDGKIQSFYRGYGESSLDKIVADINRALAAPKPSVAEAAL